MMDSEHRASSPRFQSSKTILRSLNADFGQQCKFSEINEYTGILVIIAPNCGLESVIVCHKNKLVFLYLDLSGSN